MEKAAAAKVLGQEQDWFLSQGFKGFAVQFSRSGMSDSKESTSWTAAGQASLSITSSQSLLKLMSIQLMMPSNRLIRCFAPAKEKKNAVLRCSVSGTSQSRAVRLSGRGGEFGSHQPSQAPPLMAYGSSYSFWKTSCVCRDRRPPSQGQRL